MRTKKYSHSKGFVTMIIVIVVALLLLSYFGINLRKIANSEAGKDNLSLLTDGAKKVWGWLVFAWDNFLEKPATWFYTEIWLPKVWPFIKSMLDKLF